MKKQLRNEPDIVGLITRIQQQLSLLEKKMDALLIQSLPKPAEVKPAPQPFSKPFQQPVHINVQSGNRQDNHFQAAGRQDNRHGERVMHKAICADCKKECEVPFRPSEGRPVYCKECFSRRKSGGSFKANIDNRSKTVASVQAAPMDRSQAKPQCGEKKKPVGKKKSIEKKKPVSKKRKK